MTPSSWAACRASAIAAPIARLRRMPSGPLSRSEASDSPSTYSMTMQSDGPSYVVSVLIDADFERTADHRAELNVGGIFDLLHEEEQDQRGGPMFPVYENGLPNRTGGWVRWEWEFTSPMNPHVMNFILQVFRMCTIAGQRFRIADARFLELPERALVPFAAGAGVTFRGGVGDLPMAVTSVVASCSSIVVETTGARYTFDLANDRILADQRLERKRPVATWASSVPLAGLQVSHESGSVCVLTNGEITFGVQADGMVMVSPQREVTLTCTSRIAGRWNRLYHGHLIALDDVGGFTANPCIPVGCGRLSGAVAITPDLDFVDVANDTNFLSGAPAGWQVAWTVTPGERLAISVFPPRPFDWKASFEYRPARTYDEMSFEEYDTIYPGNFSTTLPWTWSVQGYGMSFGPRYEPLGEAWVRERIARLKQMGLQPSQYISSNYYYSRDAQEYVDEVRRWRDEYGIGGVYIDGLPADQDWLVGYEQLRMVRELFPSGPITLHSTGQMGGGGAPLGVPDLFMPFIDTYATATVRGEAVEGHGADWPYARYVASQYRKANCIGIVDGDKWDVAVPDQVDLMLKYNGRAWCDPLVPQEEMRGALAWDSWRDRYGPMLDSLHGLWATKGSDPRFYEKSWLPAVRKLTGK